MIIEDKWGKVYIEPAFEKIINTREFQAMKDKSQWGLNPNPNATHTRFQHSIGTYYLACKLVDICKRKFSNLLKIDKSDEDAIKCMALVHDIGHGCFSHSSEPLLGGSHEDNTINILLDEKSEIHQTIIDNFGEEVLNKVIYLMNVTKSSYLKYMDSIILIMSKLLSGGIDVDRIDYVYRDALAVNCGKCDYSSLLDDIELEFIDDSLEIVFSDESEYKIVNFFLKRFEIYDTKIFTKEKLIIDDLFTKYVKSNYPSFNKNTTEIEMKNSFYNNIKNNDIVIKRYASCLSSQNIDDTFEIKECNSIKEFNNYKNRLYTSIPLLKQYSECLFENECHIDLYNKKNKIYLKKNGMIKEASECNQILNSGMKKDKYVIGIDLLLLKRLLVRDNVNNIDSIIKKIKKLNEIEIEQEKKYIINTSNPIECFEEIKQDFNLKEPKIINNCDTYYDYNDILKESRINVRQRITDTKTEWTVKRPLKDISSISKREEKNFSSYDEVISFLNNEWNINIPELEPKLCLNTLRNKYDIEYGNGLFELVLDKTIPVIDNNELETNYMIECELKKGSSAGLYFIDKIIKKHPFIEECTNSKKEIALKQVKSYVLVKKR